MSHNVAKEVSPRHSPSFVQDSVTPTNPADHGAFTHRCDSAGFVGSERATRSWLGSFQARSPDLRHLPQQAIIARGTWDAGLGGPKTYLVPMIRDNSLRTQAFAAAFAEHTADGMRGVRPPAKTRAYTVRFRKAFR